MVQEERLATGMSRDSYWLLQQRQAALQQLTVLVASEVAVQMSQQQEIVCLPVAVAMAFNQALNHPL